MKSMLINKNNLVLDIYHEFIDYKTSKKIFNTLENKLTYNSDESSSILIYGKKIIIPRKQVAYGDKGTFYNFSGNKVMAKDWNEDDIICRIIKQIKAKIELVSGEQFNFVLINRYKDGDDYIGYHADDEDDLEDKSTIAGVSFGCARDIYFKASNNCVQKIILKIGSLILIKYPTNQYWKHSIPKRKKIKTPRISLTFRKMKIR